MGSVAAQETRDVPSSQRCEPGSINVPIPKSWPATAGDTSIDPAAVSAKIIDSFGAALAKKDYKAIAELFAEDGFWRDHLALSWDLRTVKGRDAIVARLEETGAPLTSVTIDTTSAWRAPRFNYFDGHDRFQGIQFCLKIDTHVGSGRGLVRLIDVQGTWKVWTFYTVLTTLRGFEEPVGPRRPKGVQHGANPGRKNWLDRRIEETNFENGSPAVLIIGGGQAGLTAHARLKMLNIPTLVVDKNNAIGDNWRKRYHQLVLHDPVWYDHLPYLHFPETWPIFTPKDKLAEWLELYTKVLELNIWTRSTPESATWDDNEKQWTVQVRRGLPDGTTELRTLHPKHIIQATGHSGKPFMPAVPGMDSFKGDLLVHSSKFPGARPLDIKRGERKKAVVVGACNSSHDICQDYYERGYDVTMIQRSTTCVVSSEAATDILLGSAYSETGPPVEDADLQGWSWPAELHKLHHHDLTERQVAHDSELLDALARAGFGLDRGPDDCGLLYKYLQRGGGYYFEVGASRLVAEGKIRVRRGREVVEVLPNGLRLGAPSAGSDNGPDVVEADEIVFATGYDNMRSEARNIFGDAVADRVGGVWGFDETREIRGVWRPSGHPGFWFHGGNLAICRYFSRILALQIKAQLEGLMPLV
ncbi:hypothetical protein VTK73DRAFT_9105 [Phialemonium thermophilum]|uniref:FAD/NAD(P)-binding domain-containing protein n=1 Tax=Phialemonium thermophilum TaxID=223376 RepID=A0ABR3XM96_9PEZI